VRKLIPLSVCCLLPGCTSRDAIDRIANDCSGAKTDTIQFPMLIDGGTRIVYQFGRMTADKGLKLYYDTVPYRRETAFPLPY
jgi:hypothetical protein